MKELIQRAKKLIKENRYLSLATCSNNDPWICGLAYVVDDNYNFYFYSARDSKHCVHIKDNPYVALTIFNSVLSPEDVDGIPMKGVVSEVGLTELPKVIKLYYEQQFPDLKTREKWIQPIKAFVGVAVKRFYKIKLTEMHIIDLSSFKVDRRVDVAIEELKKDM